MPQRRQTRRKPPPRSSGNKGTKGSGKETLKREIGDGVAAAVTELGEPAMAAAAAEATAADAGTTGNTPAGDGRTTAASTPDAEFPASGPDAGNAWGGKAPGEAELAELWNQAKQVRLAYQRARAGLDEREQAVLATEDSLTRRSGGLDQAEASLAARREELDADERVREGERRALTQRVAAIDERDRALLNREVELATRLERETESLIASARAELTATRERVEAERREYEEEYRRQWSRLREDLAAERRVLDTERAELAGTREQLRQQRMELEAREEDLRDTQELYVERTQLAVRSATEQVRAEADHQRRLYEAARADADELSGQIAAYERLHRGFGGDDPNIILMELKQLRGESAELRRLRLAAPDETALRVSALEEEARQLRDRCLTFAAHNERLQRQLSAHEITAIEVERLSVSKEALDATVRAYRDQVEEQRRDWEGLIERKEGETAFAGCTAMDETYDTARTDLADVAPPLAQLVEQVRSFIRQQHGLFYETADLRSFLGGMAATQLFLLQGISGIGKTQLPQCFAEALGATSKVVSVGADWRVPQDLMGSYNPFERRFHESEFTKALYQAQCPEFAGQPFFVVLDEMNLSHPEQYFNDVLSALSREVHRSKTPDLVLMSSAVQPAPRLLREGRLLPIPRSVFFVGTANHDETTVLFADKTYDRAHVLELPARHRPFATAPQEPVQPLSWRALEAAFDAAENEYAADARRANEFFDTAFKERLATDFRVSWGGRLPRQVCRYVPAVRAAGGSLSEAADHLAATKIFRKLHGRYEVRVDKVRQLRDDLPGAWRALDGDDQPVRSLAALDGVLRDLGDN